MSGQADAARALRATCSRCGAAFDCGALAGAERCWCMDRPPVEPAPGQGCRCPRCLQDVTDRLHLSG